MFIFIVRPLSDIWSELLMFLRPLRLLDILLSCHAPLAFVTSAFPVSAKASHPFSIALKNENIKIILGPCKDLAEELRIVDIFESF